MNIISVEIVFRTLCCATCGIHYAIDQSVTSRKSDSGESWYCPNGHSQVFRKSKVDELREQLDEKQASLNSLHNQLLSKKLTIDRLEKDFKKADKRAKAGVCPCCNRTFKELVNHMASKHPEFVRKPSKMHEKISRKK